MDRKKIMDICPEEFEEALKEYIDEIELVVNSAIDYMEITRIDDISGFVDAYESLKSLAKDLY